MTSILGTPTLVDSGAYNAAYTPETGAEGVIIFMAHEQTGTGRYMQSGTIGGQPLSSILQLQQQADGSSTWIVIEAWCIKAPGIALMSGNTIAMTAHASGNGNWKGIAYSLNEWDQTTPIVTTSTDGDFSLTDLSVSVSAASGTIVIGIWAGSNGSYGTASGKALTDAGFTHDRVPTNTGTGYAIHTGYRVAIGSQTGAGSTITATLDSGDPGNASAQAAALLVFPTATVGGTPTISGASDDTPTDGSTLTLTVTNAEASQGTGGVTANGVGWTETSWSDTSVQVTVALGENRYGVDVPLVITNNSGLSSDAYNVQIQPASGKAYFNLSGTPATSGLRIEAIPDLVGTEQIEVSNVVGGSASDVIVYNNATLSIASGVTAADFRAHDGTEWGAAATQDFTPDVIAPTLTSATIGTNGTTLTLVFDEIVTIGAGGSGGFSFWTEGGSASVTYSSGSGTDTLVCTLGRTVKSTELFPEIFYTQPGDGIQDAAGNELASFGFSLTVNDSTQNAAPTDIALSKSTVSVAGGANAVVGTLSATDADYGETFTFALVAGTGDTNNASFNISGTNLRCTDPGVLGVGVYSVRVRVTDSASNTYEEAFSVEVLAIPASVRRGYVRSAARAAVRSVTWDTTN